MIYSLLADAVVALHTAFVAFVVLGGLFALRWPRAAWVHIPCALWGMWIEWANWICPLTPLENDLRQRAGELGYSGGFLGRYLVPLLYPEGLTRGLEIGLGVTVLVVNLAIYAVALRRWRRSSTSGPSS